MKMSNVKIPACAKASAGKQMTNECQMTQCQMFFFFINEYKDIISQSIIM